jgi:hypothetical protein
LIREAVAKDRQAHYREEIDRGWGVVFKCGYSVIFVSKGGIDVVIENAAISATRKGIM